MEKGHVIIKSNELQKVDLRKLKTQNVVVGDVDWIFKLLKWNKNASKR